MDEGSLSYTIGSSGNSVGPGVSFGAGGAHLENVHDEFFTSLVVLAGSCRIAFAKTSDVGRRRQEHATRHFSCLNISPTSLLNAKLS